MKEYFRGGGHNGAWITGGWSSGKAFCQVTYNLSPEIGEWALGGQEKDARREEPGEVRG